MHDAGIKLIAGYPLLNFLLTPARDGYSYLMLEAPDSSHSEPFRVESINILRSLWDFQILKAVSTKKSTNYLPVSPLQNTVSIIIQLIVEVEETVGTGHNLTAVAYIFFF